MPRLAIAAALILAASPALAGMLPTESLLCSNMGSMREADSAIRNGDVEWLRSLRACVVTGEEARASRIDCDTRLESGNRVCRIRYWAPDGRSAIGYTYLRSLH